MEKNYSLLQRLLNDTPTFFKKAQILGSGLVLLSVSLGKIEILPAQLVTIVASVGATMAAISQFAVKQYDYIKTEKNEQIK